MRLAALQSLINTRLASYWVTRPHHGLTVSSQPSRCLLPCRPPFPCEKGFILSYASSSLQSTSPPQTYREHACSPVPSLRFRPPSRHQLNESTCNEQSQVRLVPPSAFLPLSMVSSSSSLVGLFHPTATSEIHSSGVSPSSQSFELSPVGTLMSFLSFAYREASFPGPAPDLRLQGFDSDCRSVVAIGWFRPNSPRSPLEFSLPQVFVRPPW